MKIKKISDTLINSFETYLKDEEKSQNTIEKYIRDIKLFCIYAGNKEITKELTIAFKKHLQDSKYAVRSINSMLASINSFFAFIERNDCKVKAMKIQREIYCPEDKELTKEEYFRLVKTAKRQGNERLNLIIQTICSTGIRISELEFITVEAAREGKAIISLKGKTRTVLILEELKSKLLKYASARKIKNGNIFISRTGKALSRSNIWREMKKLCQNAGINPEKVFPHNLRHLFARTFYCIEKDIAKLADLLGHSNINTTRIYIMTTAFEHKRRMEKMHLLI